VGLPIKHVMTIGKGGFLKRVGPFLPTRLFGKGLHPAMVPKFLKQTKNFKIPEVEKKRNSKIQKNI